MIQKAKKYNELVFILYLQPYFLLTVVQVVFYGCGKVGGLMLDMMLQTQTQLQAQVLSDGILKDELL